MLFLGSVNFFQKRGEGIILGSKKPDHAKFDSYGKKFPNQKSAPQNDKILVQTLISSSKSPKFV